ncbi:MAG: FAD:protein FMN transferase [bacterium]
MELSWKKFNAMGTEIVLLAELQPEQRYLLDKAVSAINEFDLRFSRFKEKSELNVFNKFQGGTYQASEMLADILKHSQKYYKETNGLFDPLVIDILEAIGYKNTFNETGKEQLTYDEELARRSVAKKIFAARPKLDQLIIDGTKLVVPEGLRFDTGGIGKGYIVDILANDIFKNIDNYWLSAGGDLLIKGSDLGKIGWKVGVQNPLVDNQESFSINTLGETMGIATSGVIKRQGIVGGIKWHHIIDPRTGEPAVTDVISVTMIAPTAEEADIYAKTVLMLGSKEGLEFVESRDGLECAIFFRDKAPIFSRGIIKYL